MGKAPKAFFSTVIPVLPNVTFTICPVSSLPYLLPQYSVFTHLPAFVFPTHRMFSLNQEYEINFAYPSAL